MLAPDQIVPWLGWSTTGDFGPWTTYTSPKQGIVIFLKASLKDAASPAQIAHRNRWRTAVANWHAATPDERARWMLAARRCQIPFNGIALWIHFSYSQDADALATLRRQSKLALTMPPPVYADITERPITTR